MAKIPRVLASIAVVQIIFYPNTAMFNFSASVTGVSTNVKYLVLVACSHAAGDEEEDDFLWDTFPEGFSWGAATSAYQVEGGWNADGKGESIWDRFCHVGGKIVNNDTGDVACDSYHHYEDDIDILSDLRVQVYRFSLAWSRILPDGNLAVVNEAGIDYYNRLIDGLLHEGIQPMVTLCHWDLPQALEDIGGWLNKDVVNYFNDYARLCFERFGDRVKLWITLNDPMMLAWYGYGIGVIAPGAYNPDIGAYQAAHNMIKAHAEAWHTYDKEFRQDQNGKVSVSLVTNWMKPYSDKAEDIEAAERATEFMLGWFANPIYVDGDYPQVMKDYIGRKSKMEGLSKSRLPKFTKKEKSRILGTYDFFALILFTSNVIKHQDRGIEWPSWDYDRDVEASFDPSWPLSGSPWLCEVPPGIRKALNWAKDSYNNPEIYITENGVTDDKEHYGSLDDQQRIRFHTNYINNVLKAIKLDGCNVIGYNARSLMDNFQWNEGYGSTFGLYRVNFSDPERARVPKASADFYRKLIANNGWPSP